MERNVEIVRQWKILKAIERASDCTIPKLAQAFKVCTRTIRRDLAALQEAGFPLYDERVENKVYWRLSGKPFKALAETAFTLSELCAFHVDRARLAMTGGLPPGGEGGGGVGGLRALLRPPDDATVVARARNSHLISEVAAASGSRASAEEGAMGEETLENRLSTLEQRVEQQATVRDLEALQAALSAQILQLGSGMRQHARTLHEDVIERIKVISRG